MAERKTGAGSHLSGVLERAQPPSPESPVESEASPVEANPKGRGGAQAPKPARPSAARIVKKSKGRTVYLPDDLFERIIVQAHRRDLTISDYIASLLERHVPDHRRIGAGASPTGQADPGESEAA
jgi:hypothetical protein